MIMISGSWIRISISRINPCFLRDSREILIYRRFREKVTWGCKMNLYKLHFINSHSKSQDSEFLDTEEFAQLSFTLGCLMTNIISISLK